jgi:histidinol-phosphate aminotransferase
MYDVYGQHIDAVMVKTSSQEHNLDEFYKLYLEHKPEIIFICTPNNPTGDALDAKEIYEFIAKIDKDTLVVVDGAYMEFAKYKDLSKAIEPNDLIEKFDNVLYLGTFSKAYGLGGMRVGYGISSAKITKELYKLRPPFNITTLSLEAASVALEDLEFVEFGMQKNFEQMQRYVEFAKEKNIDIIPSYTNFITLCLQDSLSSSEIANKLLQKGMIVRDLRGYKMNAIRVTIGTNEQNSRFFELISELI